MRRWFMIGLISLWCGLTFAAERSGIPKPLSWKINGEKREAIVEFPAGPRDQPAPVVFIFHGHGNTMEKFAQRWDVHKHWPEAVAVYPQGLPTASRVDPKGKHAGWQTLAGTEGDRDLKLVDAILKTLHDKHAIDDDRIFSAGLSNGGGFSYVLWTARSDVFSAYAPCAAILHVPKNMTLKPGPVLHIAGENDHTAPFEEQMESMKTVRRINGCKAQPVDWGEVGKLYAPKTKSGAPFISIIHPGGHGAPPHTFEAIIKFFKEHPRKHSTTD